MTTFYQALTLILLLCANLALANIFGDGDPGNGVEDDRQDLNSPAAPGTPLDSWRNSAGIILCEGLTRGSAMILDVARFADDVPGTFLATAAHVLVDLDSGRSFEFCEFHFLALGHVPGYRAVIEPGWVRAGPFDPDADIRSPAFGRDDWAFIYLPPQWEARTPAGGIAPATFPSTPNPPPVGGQFLLVAYDRSTRQLGVSAPCAAVYSMPGDLGGGAWRGQLLDSCDSGDGASGGGLVFAREGGHFLVGLRTGAHWSPSAYPVADFPSGPPPGARWDVRHNTNFARAIDDRMLLALRELISEALNSTIDIE